MRKIVLGMVAAGALTGAAVAPALAQVGVYAGPGGVGVGVGPVGVGVGPYYDYGAPSYGYYNYAGPGWHGGRYGSHHRYYRHR